MDKITVRAERLQQHINDEVTYLQSIGLTEYGTGRLRALQEVKPFADALASPAKAQSVRAQRLVAQVMKTWGPPLLSGAERPADIAQSSVMIALAYVMGREFMPADLTDNQWAAIEQGLALMQRELDGK